MVLQVQPPAKTLKFKWTKEQLKDAFKGYDLNGDGRLSKEELKQAFKGLGSNCGTYRARRALYRADTDNNGYVEITDEELEELVNYALKCGYNLPNT